jgi:uncharacterized pyridoxamine 5'-phosphate oxidase family protein
MKKLTAKMRKEIWSHFKDFQTVYLATSSEGQPRTRPVTLAFLDGKFWLITGAKSKKAREMAENPRVELCLPLRGGEFQGYLRIGARAAPVKSLRTRAKVAGKAPYAKEYWKGPGDPMLAVFEFKPGELEYLKPGETWPVRYGLR